MSLSPTAGLAYKQRVLGSLALAVGLTLLTLGWLSGTVFRGYRFVTVQLPEIVRVEELRGKILLIDETLTMSVWMAAVTGDPQWEARYHRFEPQLEEALKDARHWAPALVGSQATAQTDAANTKLVVMEKRAFELARQRQPAAAQQLLYSPEYGAQKKAYADGMAEMTRLLEQSTQSVQGKQQVELLGSVIIAAISAAALILSWWFAWRAVRRWQTAIMASNQQLNRQTAELRESEVRFRALIEQAGDGFELLDLEGRFIDMNSATCRLLGYTREELLGMSIPDIDPNTSREKFISLTQGMTTDTKITLETTHRRKDGTIFQVEITASMIQIAGVPWFLSLARDITERKRAEAEKTKLEAQFQQAQKMESVGRLAGGVAHDFNNMLGVILGNVEMAMDQVDPAQPLFGDLEEIRKAARRSADLTRQLLAFARRQTIAPKVLDLNEAVEGLLKLLRRLIGENIDLAWLPAVGLGPVKMDPTQIDQILANLCVNARDAIGGVGKITIETGNAVFDEAYCADHPGFVPGEYVMLAVSDNGCGMDQETLAHLFEPFFTTKGVGEGTGLGLATIYGIVKQNHGFIHVYSEPGQGTTFKIYLPRHAAQATATRTETVGELPRSAGETVLLVEDELAILAMARRVLERLGYTVLAASTPGEAIRLAGTHAGEIQLLMTDVVMPEMNGRDLTRQLLSLHPKLKCLFMSGYTANVIAHHGVLDEGVHFIQKPFSMEDLAAKVREALEGNDE